MRIAAVILGVIVSAGCTPHGDDIDTAQPQRSTDTAVSAAAPADTFPPEMVALWPDEMPPGDGPLVPFADSSARPTRWGMRDAGGRVVVAPRYHYTTPMFEGRAAVAEADGHWTQRWGYVDARGDVVITPRFDGAGVFANGRAPVLLDDDYSLIDSTGTIVERLAARRDGATSPSLPEPCDSCTLGEYARRLPRVGGPMQVYVQPSVGESLRRIAILRHPGDLLSVAEGGWEHWVRELRAPGLTREQGITLAKRIMGAGQYTEAADPGDPGDPDVIVLRATGARVETGNEEIRVRVRNGVVEIVHSDGV